MMQFFSNKKKGFTLIELLVVIAIIGILSTIVLVSMGSARAKARDAKRQSDIRQIATAMELAYTDNGNAYVTSTANAPFTTYLADAPTDPGGGTVAGCNDTAGAAYGFVNNTTDVSGFCVYACLESGEILSAVRLE